MKVQSVCCCLQTHVLTVKLPGSVKTGWKYLVPVHLKGSLTMPQKYDRVNIYNFNLHSFWSMEGGWRAVKVFFSHTLWLAKLFILMLMVAEIGFWTVHQKGTSCFPWNSALPKGNELAVAALAREKIILLQSCYSFWSRSCSNLGILFFSGGEGFNCI